MSVTLSHRDGSRLQAALLALLSPLDQPSSDNWLSECSRRVAALLGADQAVGMMPSRTPGVPVMFGAGYDIGRALAEYPDFIQFDTGLHQVRQRLGLEVYHQRHLYELRSFHRSPVYNDWAAPHRLMDVIGMGYNPIPGEAIACLHLYHDRDHGPEDSEGEGAFGQRGLALLELLLPAWKAGVRQHFTFEAHRGALSQLFDRLEDGVAVYNLAGRQSYRNVALTRMIAQDPEGSRLASIIRLTATRAAGIQTDTGGFANHTTTLAQTIRTVGGHYRLETSLATLGGLGPDPSIIAIVSKSSPRPLTDGELKAKYRLTGRECETARLLASGRSNSAIAAALRVTESTARRHTEAVLRKLSVPSRAAVGAVLHSDFSLVRQ